MHIKIKDVLALNYKKINDISNSIALFESENVGKSFINESENFSSLISSIFLYVGAKVLLIRNYLNVGLSNSSIGIIK